MGLRTRRRLLTVPDKFAVATQVADSCAPNGRWKRYRSDYFQAERFVDQILLARDGAIATIALSNPGKLNALTRRMWEGIAAMITALMVKASLSRALRWA